MNFFKDYIYLFFLLLVMISYLFIDFIDGANIFTSGDTLSPIAVKNSIKFYLDTFNEFPFWFSPILGGIPTVHSFLHISNYYYPHHIMMFLNQFGVPWFWNFIFHLVFGSIGMYSLLIFLKQNRISAIFGAILFLFMPYMITMTAYGHGSQMMSGVYIPWIILYLFKISNKIKLIDLCIFSLLVGFQLLRGHIQIAYYTWMMIGLFVIVSLFYKYFISKTEILKILKKSLAVIIFSLIGLILSLSVYLPILSYSTHSIRGAVAGGAGLEYATQWSMSIKEFLTILFPYSLGFGGPLYIGDLPFTDYPNYVGILVLYLSIIGFINSNISKLYKTFFLLVMIFSFLISLGSNFIEFYSLFYNYFPYFNKFRVPSYILILFNFSIIIFAASGLKEISSTLKNDLFKNKAYYISFLFLIITILSYKFSGSFIIADDYQYKTILMNLIDYDAKILLLLILFAIFIYFIFNYKKLKKQTFQLLIVAICSYDYIRINQEIIDPERHIPHKQISKPSRYINKFIDEDEITSFFKQDTSKYRIYDYIGNPNRWAIYGIENIGGYHPAKLNNYSKFINSIYDKGYQLFPPGILQLLNMKYIILPNSNFFHEDFTYLGSKNMSYFGNNGKYDGQKIKVDLFVFNDYYPRLFFSNEVKYEHKDYILDNILNQTYNPHNLVYVSEEIQPFISDTLNRSVELVSWSPNKIEFSTSSFSDQFLVVSEIFYPNDWKLTMDGNDHKIYEVNNIVRGIRIPKGNHYFKMEFVSKSIDVGTRLSKIVLYLLLLIVFIKIFLIRKKYF